MSTRSVARCFPLSRCLRNLSAHRSSRKELSISPFQQVLWKDVIGINICNDPSICRSHDVTSVGCHKRYISSTSSSTKSTSSTTTTSNLRKLIQPFILKCHPDMAKQQGLPKKAQKINLVAIQNLNSYLDNVTQYLKTQRYPFGHVNNKTSIPTVIEIEFIMALSNPRKAILDNTTANTNTAASSLSLRGQPITTSRRKVELQVPSSTLTMLKVERHVQKQIIKLLRISGLPIPSNLSLSLTYHGKEEEELEEEEDDDDDDSESLQTRKRRRRRMTPYERSRNHFWNYRIKWKQFQKLYQEALDDAHAHIMTRNKIRNTPKLRQTMLARILSNIQFANAITPLEKLVAYRRLLHTFDTCFDELYLEDFGLYWEYYVTISVEQSRPYNISTSALRRRRLQNLETGYRFTIHYNNNVTITIPIDFTQQELIQELTRNIIDFVEWTSSTAAATTTTNQANQPFGSFSGGGIHSIYSSIINE